MTEEDDGVPEKDKFQLLSETKVMTFFTRLVSCSFSLLGVLCSMHSSLSFSVLYFEVPTLCLADQLQKASCIRVLCSSLWQSSPYNVFQ